MRICAAAVSCPLSLRLNPDVFFPHRVLLSFAYPLLSLLTFNTSDHAD